MSRFAVSSTNDYLTRDGKPFFYLADTAWMAFSNLTIADWTRYLTYRKRQGFNALQISILPITHDTSMSDDNIDPFLPDANGNWNFTAYNDAYFAQAEQMVAMAVEANFVPVLGILWCSYVPNTRCSKSSPVASAMPFETVAPYATYVAERFKQYDPMFFISGDTRFESAEEEPYYMTALNAVKAVCPDALLTMHLHPEGDLPHSFMDKVDFYMYQSGHGARQQNQPYTFAQKFAAYAVQRPVVNSEPCYEGHGRIGETTRFNAFDIRKATWQSLLSGAKMGITYGAHGIWSFHRKGMNFLNKNRSFEPYDWDIALELEGGWDVSFAKWIFEVYQLFDLQPANIVLNEDTEIRAAVNSNQTQVVIYSPYSFDIQLDFDLTGFDVVAMDLASRRVFIPEVSVGSTSHIAMPQRNTDTLILAVRE